MATTTLFLSLFSLLLAGSITQCSGSTASIALTKDNFAEATAGKTVFIKFYAPWCGHCQTIEPEWEKMAREWKDHTQGFVGEIDCTKDEDHVKWCQKEMRIDGFPFLYFGETSHGGVFLQEYHGERKYEDLSKFANETLGKPMCSGGNPDGCDEKTKKEIETYWKWSIPEIEKKIKEKEDALVDVETTFRENFSRMQKQYDELSTNHEIATTALKQKIRILQETKQSK